MQSSINNNTYCFRQKCSRIDVINQIIAKKSNQKNDSLQTKFQQFYRDRMLLNKIQKKDKLELHDQMIRLYKNNQIYQQVNLSITTQENTYTASYSKTLKATIDKKRPRSQSTNRHISNSSNKKPYLIDLLKISPKCISTRNTISSRGDLRSIRKNIFLDALILQQESQDIY